MYLGLGINKLHEKVMRETVTSAEAYAYRVAGGLPYTRAGEGGRRGGWRGRQRLAALWLGWQCR
jgi:hypothetical protein